MLLKYEEFIDERKRIREEETRGNDESNSSTTSSNTSFGTDEMKKKFWFLTQHEHISRLIQVSTLIWGVFRNDLDNDEETLGSLHTLIIYSFPRMLLYYKGSSVYYSAISLATLVPIGKITPVSTVTSACISHLREVDDTTDRDNIHCLIYALCSWDRGNEVLDLITEWINYAFRTQSLNNSAMNIDSTTKKVHFQITKGKPLLALKLLDVLFGDVMNETRLNFKYYDQITEFYYFIERILIVIENKLSGAEEFNDSDTCLTEEFLQGTLSRYLMLMHSLHNHDPMKNGIRKFDAAKTTFAASNWAAKVLYPKIPITQELDEPTFAFKCCLDVLKHATLSLALGETDQEHCRGVCIFTQDILFIGATWHIEDIIVAMDTIIQYAEYYTLDDEWHLLSEMLPSMVEKTLNILANLDLTQSSMKTYFKNLPNLKRNLFSLPTVLIKRYGDDNQLFLGCFRNFVLTCILLVHQQLNFEEEFNANSKIEGLPWLASLILKYIIVKPYFVVHLVPTLIYFIKSFEQEGLKLLSCIQILYIIILSVSQQFDKSKLEEAIQISYELLMNIKPKEKPSEPNDSFDGASSTTISLDVKKEGVPVLQELSKFLNCALIRFSSTDIQNEENL